MENSGHFGKFFFFPYSWNLLRCEVYINIWSEKDIKIISLHFFLCRLNLCPLKYFDSKGILAIFVVKCDILTVLDYMSFFIEIPMDF